MGTTSTGAVAFIRASWHSSIVNKAHEGFLAEYAGLGFDPAAVEVFDVPGAFEIPLHAQRLARTGRYEAIVAAALVVDGGIYRHDFVASAVIDGLMRVQLDTDVPVFSVVLTPHHFHEHSEHVDYYTNHFVTKGAEAARAVANTLSSLRSLPVAP
ncbi:6,7-dimethyl-8-ribityllumazine synthase [Nocardia asteroides]|uniref:6,7-dimethyl-8-ribityllumazine synthase n=1 Tax=Nocardia asteroides NBRC 15531 TaxID=1110697 RepID=U5EBF9_NOCAS|nr:6,7-dimethyl-8-ribityllumazine synthase [Nocardia asteroides]TLF63690.1 6,7-dimethyl-8-ribityllumazine synthase [Nocardia asteroides NBRC 15531]UGT46846.1 6,7-dimethyl-8-ribityllumazine synthase [Nocardia asteroides]SFM86772.1 6,7-dimethyl-8-ribityllumazine synthase [Nocardia asteroides]VEG34300.1 6,7-dimethyl-8-ribityllumazine synthase 2 [Nocardia asteroides]GAD87462.1 6,7-dimethyl-8-ribityllumazine synthase [Nocardia asteroides NBRC 15531]